MACENPNKTAAGTAQPYFDLKGFVQTQITWLNQQQPKVKKQVRNEGKLVTKTLAIKNWEKELRMFINADINKAALIGTYDIVKKGKIIKYTTKEEKNSVKEMTVELGNDKKVAKSVKIIVGNDNALFASGTKLIIQCQNKGNDYRITTYTIDGFQKIIMRDKRPYFIHAKVL
ncbi:hypothetical protein M23134_04016 [Microscilla marina ATCC 23134]|uniref:Uncharacterized protein n=2 Tax=Microscilla marina TaxID=1027 RepID=A1ZMS3_MICM2|nr:hypothetical protein M23134_04016 [Microscilla marina ATCC 23134]